MAMVLLNTNQEATDTAASNSLVTLRKSRGLPMAAAANFRLVSGDGIRAEADASSLQSIVPKPSVMTTTGDDEGEFNTISSNTFFADALARTHPCPMRNRSSWSLQFPSRSTTSSSPRAHRLHSLPKSTRLYKSCRTTDIHPTNPLSF